MFNTVAGAGGMMAQAHEPREQRFDLQQMLRELAVETGQGPMLDVPAGAAARLPGCEQARPTHMTHTTHGMPERWPGHGRD